MLVRTIFERRPSSCSRWRRVNTFRLSSLVTRLSLSARILMECSMNSSRILLLLIMFVARGPSRHRRGWRSQTMRAPLFTCPRVST